MRQASTVMQDPPTVPRVRQDGTAQPSEVWLGIEAVAFSSKMWENQCYAQIQWYAGCFCQCWVRVIAAVLYTCKMWDNQ